MLIFSDEVCIDNTRKIISLYPRSDVFELEDNTVLVINDNVCVNSAYGIGRKSSGISVLGKKCAVYLNSSSANFTSGPFIVSRDSTSKIKVNSGKYFSLGKESTFLINCKLTIKGGLVDSIKGLENSKITLLGGIIGEINQSKMPIESWGKVNIKNGNIRSKDGISVLMHTQKTKRQNNINLSHGVDIEGKIIYN